MADLDAGALLHQLYVAVGKPGGGGVAACGVLLCEERKANGAQPLLVAVL